MPGSVLSSEDSKVRHYPPGCHLLQGDRQVNKQRRTHMTTPAGVGPTAEVRMEAGRLCLTENQIYPGL